MSDVGVSAVSSQSPCAPLTVTNSARTGSRPDLIDLFIREVI